jgi:hypothetical protein
MLLALFSNSGSIQLQNKKNRIMELVTTNEKLEEARAESSLISGNRIVIFMTHKAGRISHHPIVVPMLRMCSLY